MTEITPCALHYKLQPLTTLTPFSILSLGLSSSLSAAFPLSSQVGHPTSLQVTWYVIYIDPLLPSPLLLLSKVVVVVLTEAVN